MGNDKLMMLEIFSYAFVSINFKVSHLLAATIQLLKALLRTLEIVYFILFHCLLCFLFYILIFISCFDSCCIS